MQGSVMVNCPICKYTKTRHYYSDKILTLLYCKKCGVKFQHPMPTPEMLKQLYSSEYYDTYYPDRILNEQKLLFNVRLEMLEELNGRKKGRVLDIGSGCGIFLEAARERGWDYLGYEFSRNAAESIRNSLGIEVSVCGDFTETQLLSESFDLVHMNHVLEHLDNPQDVVNEIYRILKPGGLFYCEVPRQNNFLNLLSNLFRKGDFGFTYKPVHLFIFNIPSILFLFGNTGFKLVVLKIKGISDPHRYVYGVHYTSLLTRIITKVIGLSRLEKPLGGGNLVVISRKPSINN